METSLPIVYQLKFPIEFPAGSGKFVTEFTIKDRIKAKHVRHVKASMFADGELLDAGFLVLAELTGLSASVVLETDLEDIAGLMKEHASFFAGFLTMLGKS